MIALACIVLYTSVLVYSGYYKKIPETGQLTTTNLFSHCFRGQNSEISLLAALDPTGVLKHNLFHASLLASGVCWQSLMSLVNALLKSFLLYLHGIFPCVFVPSQGHFPSVCACVHKFLQSNENTSHWLKAHSNTTYLILT